MIDDDDAMDIKMKRYREVLRHEITHAFFSESGLDGYCIDETLVDWIAKQFPKLCKIFAECDCFDIDGEKAAIFKCGELLCVKSDETPPNSDAVEKYAKVCMG